MNWDVIGHEWAVSLLKEHIARDKLRHAYLLSGPQGVGRRTIALRFIKAINCLEPPAPGEACGACRICLQVEHQVHPDLAVVQAEGYRGTLKVDQVRELQRSLILSPYEARYRVALLLRFEEANANAMNALLKTLEEPPDKVIVILTAESPERLLPTIVSRCEVVRLRSLPLSQVKQGLEKVWGLTANEANRLAHYSNGSPGYAYLLHQEPERLQKHKDWLDEHIRLLSANRLERFVHAELISKDKEALRMNLLAWLSFWRDIMLKAAESTAPITNFDHFETVVNIASRVGVEKSRQVVASLENTLDLLDKNINARLAVDVLMLDLPTD